MRLLRKTDVRMERKNESRGLKQMREIYSHMMMMVNPIPDQDSGSVLLFEPYSALKYIIYLIRN